jgi:type IV pilus assembly protein PilB
MRTLFEDGMIKAMKGQTSLEEVLRITQHDMVDATRAEAAK